MTRSTLTRSGGARRVLAVATALLSTVGLVGAGTASAQTGSLDSPQWPDFYAAPAELPAASGDLVRSEPMSLVATVPGLGSPWAYTSAQRIMYRSVGATGKPVGVSGTVIQSSAPWTGGGARPIAAVAPGTQGQGDQCAPSKSFANGLTVQVEQPSLGAGYELIQAATLLARGFDVVVTDYEGLGTEGVHTYVDRESEGHAVLDSVRAAQHVPGSRVTADTPVVLSGYSQGGGASGAAAELAPTYAPDLHVVAAAVSAPPADLPAVLQRIDGSLISGAVGYALNGFVYSHPELRPLLDRKLNEHGKQVLDTLSHQCIADTVVTFGLHQSSELTADGRPASQVLAEIPEAVAVMDHQRIGRLKPTVPVRVQGNVADDGVAYPQVEQLARDWCALGADVTFIADQTPPILTRSVINHMLPMITHANESADYLVSRASGAPAGNSCGQLPA